MSKRTEIFKIQQDFTHTLCLVYNNNRSIMGQFPLDKEMKKFLNGKMKVYAWGWYNEKTTKVEFSRHCTKEELKDIFW